MTMICEPYTVVDVPFPFSDLPRSKRRKALVLSSETLQRRNGATILMMITSATGSTWHLDVPLVGWEAAGLRKPCVARPKLFTLDNRLIIGRVGTLTAADVQSVAQVLGDAMPVLTGT